jgi:hypothetical protein
MKHESTTSIQNKKTEHAVEAPWLIPSEEIQEGSVGKIIASIRWNSHN